MAQRLPTLHLFDFVPTFRQVNSRRGLSGAVHAASLSSELGIVFKRFHVTLDFTEETAYKALICELMVLEHPILKQHRNIQELLGVAWDVQIFQGTLVRVMPVLVFKRSDRDIVHGDIKPDNILIFKDETGFMAKVIDFGCSCFGSRNDDLVLLSRTAQWAAPEVGTSHISIEAAKLADIYSYGMLTGAITYIAYQTSSGIFSGYVSYIALGVLAALPLIHIGIYLCFFEELKHLWYKLQHIWRSLSIYGETQHAIPHLPDIYSFLNETHYLVREQLVKDLERRIQRGCIKCKPDAALQLALCYYTALGTPKNTTASERWLKYAQKTERHLGKLCKDVDYSINLNVRTKLVILEGKEFRSYSHMFTVRDKDKYFENILPTLIRRISQEIEGKEASKVGLQTIASLHWELATIYWVHNDLELAEYHFRAEKLIYLERPFLGPCKYISARTSHKRERQSYATSTALATVLDAQGRESEALKELQADRYLMKNPNGSHPDWAILSVTLEKRDFVSRAMLANLLIRQECSDIALRLDLLSDLDDIRFHRDKDSYIMTQCLENILALAQLLFKQMRKDTAADLLRKRLKAHVEMFGTLHPRTMKATSDFIFILSNMEDEQLDEAICLQPPTLDNFSEEVNTEVLLFKTAFALALSKKGRIDDAIAEIDLILQYKKRNWTHGEYVTQGCISDLASSLCVQGEGEYGMPALMQHEMLEISKKTQSLEVKAQIIAILCTLPRLGALDEVLTGMRLLEEALRNLCQDQRDRIKMQGFIVFILANLGLCFENPLLVGEALDLSIALKEEVVEKPGWNEIDRLSVMRSLASVYWIKSFIACQCHGFGIHDLSWMDQAEQIHREAICMATASFGDDHEETVHTIEKMDSLLARHGTAQADPYRLNVLHSLLRKEFLGPGWYNGCWGSKFLDFYDALDKYNAQDAYFHKGQERYLEETLGEEHPGVLAEIERQARINPQYEIFKDTRKPLIYVLESIRKYYKHSNMKPDYHPQVIRTLEALAQAYRREGKTFQSLATSKYVLHLARKTFTGGDRHPSFIAYRIRLMKTLFQDNVTFAKKVENARELLKLSTETLGIQHTQTLSCMNALAEILCEQDQNSEAMHLMQDALELGLPFLGVNHSIVSQSWTNLLAAMNYATRDSGDLLVRVEEIIHSLRVASQPSEPIFFDSASLLRVFAEVKRMTLGAIVLGDEHKFTRVQAFSDI
ncbi:MAG: hypothetical protein Q9187_001522 [Circinaria calcarea]